MPDPIRRKLDGRVIIYKPARVLPSGLSDRSLTITSLAVWAVFAVLVALPWIF